MNYCRKLLYLLPRRCPRRCPQEMWLAGTTGNTLPLTQHARYFQFSFNFSRFACLRFHSCQRKITIDLICFAQPRFNFLANIEVREDSGVFNEAQIYQYQHPSGPSIVVLYLRDEEIFEGFDGDYVMKDGKIIADGDTMDCRNLDCCFLSNNYPDHQQISDTAKIISWNATFGEKASYELLRGSNTVRSPSARLSVGLHTHTHTHTRVLFT